MAMDKLENKKLAIIGSGHIAQALIAGLIRGGAVQASQIIVSNPSGVDLKKIRRIFHVAVTKDNTMAATNADWIFIAVKPLVVRQVLEELRGHIKNKLLISLAVAVNLKTLKRYACGPDAYFVRAMPNLSIADNQGVIGMCADRSVSHAEKENLYRVLQTLGYVLNTNREDDLEVLTLISACGPAVVARFIEMVTDYGEGMGLSAEFAQKVVLQTFIGTLAHLRASKQSLSALIDRVATKGGITEAILKKMEKGDFNQAFHLAMSVGRKRINELRKKLT